MVLAIENDPSGAEAQDSWELACGTAEAVPFQSKNVLHFRVRAIAFGPRRPICGFRAAGRQWFAMGWMGRMRVGCAERTLAGLHWIARRRGGASALPAHLETGIEGEDAAFFYLRRKGYMVVARRWSSGSVDGDLDLIAWQGPMLCFIEVKTRTAHDIAPAEARVDSHKRHVLRRLARQYVRQLPTETAPPVRFDVLSVYLVPGEEKEFVHFENSFGWGERREDWE